MLLRRLYITIIKEKRSHEFKKEQGVDKKGFGGQEKKAKSIILNQKIKGINLKTNISTT